MVQGQELEPFLVTARVLQGSILLLILFLFYNAELLDICNQLQQRLLVIGFANNVNILIYRRSIEINCYILEHIHLRCLDQAGRFGISFALAKYKLIYFTCYYIKFNLQASLNLGTVLKTPILDIQVLGVWLDTKLQWAAYIQEVKKKTLVQQYAL